MNNGAVIGINVILNNKEITLRISPECDGSLIANKKLNLLEASFIDMESLMIRNIRIPDSI
jgi:hypothetical protein